MHDFPLNSSVYVEFTAPILPTVSQFSYSELNTDACPVFYRRGIIIDGYCQLGIPYVSVKLDSAQGRLPAPIVVHIDLANIQKSLLLSPPRSEKSSVLSLSWQFSKVDQSLRFSSPPPSGAWVEAPRDPLEEFPPDHHLRMMGFEDRANLHGAYKANRLAKLASMQRTLLAFLKGERYLRGLVHQWLEAKLKSLDWPFSAAQVIAQAHQFPPKKIPFSWLTARTAWLINWTDTDRNRGNALRVTLDRKLTAHVKEAVKWSFPLRGGDAVKRVRMQKGRHSLRNLPAARHPTLAPLSAAALTTLEFNELEAVAACPFCGKSLTESEHSRQHFFGVGVFLSKLKGVSFACSDFGIGAFFVPESGELFSSRFTSDSPDAFFGLPAAGEATPLSLILHLFRRLYENKILITRRYHETLAIARLQPELADLTPMGRPMPQGGFSFRERANICHDGKSSRGVRTLALRKLGRAVADRALKKALAQGGHFEELTLGVLTLNLTRHPNDIYQLLVQKGLSEHDTVVRQGDQIRLAGPLAQIRRTQQWLMAELEHHPEWSAAHSEVSQSLVTYGHVSRDEEMVGPALDGRCRWAGCVEKYGSRHKERIEHEISCTRRSPNQIAEPESVLTAGAKRKLVEKGVPYRPGPAPPSRLQLEAKFLLGRLTGRQARVRITLQDWRFWARKSVSGNLTAVRAFLLELFPNASSLTCTIINAGRAYDEDIDALFLQGSVTHIRALLNFFT